MDLTNKISTSEDTLESWVNLYTNSMFSWAFHKTSDKQGAEDLVQDTFLTAYQQLDKFRGESLPKTWLLGILNNKIAQYYRLKYRNPVKRESEKDQTTLSYDYFDKNEQWKNNEQPQSWDHMENHLLDNKEFNRILQSCMAGLPEHWRSAVHLKYIDQQKGEMICQELGISPTNFWQVLHRAKLKLRRCLETNWFNA